MSLATIFAHSQNLVLNGSFEDSDFSTHISPMWDWNPEDGGVCWHRYNWPAYNQDPDAIAHFAFLRDAYAGGIGVYSFPCNPVCGTSHGTDWWDENWQEVGVDSPAVFDPIIADSLVATYPDLYSHVYGDGHWYGSAQEGDWFVGVFAYDSIIFFGGVYESNPFSSAFSLALSEPLQVGEWYQLRYWIMAPQIPSSGWHVSGTNSVEIGFSMQDTLFGDTVHLSYFPNQEEDTTWILQETYFQAQQPYEHLTCAGHKRRHLYNKRILFVDNFSVEWCPAPCDTTSANEPPDIPVDSNEVGLTERPSQELSLYPNPFVDVLTLESTAQRLVLYDLLGRVQHQQALQENSSKLDLKHLPLGMYLLKTYDTQGNEIGQEKVLKMRH